MRISDWSSDVCSSDLVKPETYTPKLLTVFREGYSAATFRADAIAGLTVAIVALPLAMALGIASGASPDKGLITAVVAGFLISALGGSRVQVGGPTGARSEEHTSELQSLMRNSYAVFCLKKKKTQ